MKTLKYAMGLLLALGLLLLYAGSVAADGFIVVPRPPRPEPMPNWQPFPLEVKYHKVEVDIRDTAATTSIDQEFYNPTNWQLEGYYIFPIPVGAVISKFSMFINGKETEAEMLDAKKARAIYEDIVRRNIDPALLEYYQQGLFRVRIFPIEPRSTKRVKISYHQILTGDNGTTEYLYPLNTEKFSAKDLQEVVVRVNLSSQFPLKNIYSPTHEVDIVRKGPNRAVISYEARQVKPDRDFSLFFRTDSAKIGMSALTFREAGDPKGFFLLDIAPDFEVKDTDIEDKDITFVLDVSGSMAGDKLQQAKKALLFCINNLNRGDRFEVIRFSTEAEALFNGVVLANEENRQKAIRFVENLKAIGGTNIEDALKLALQQKSGSWRPQAVLFITDGKPTLNEMDDEKLANLAVKRTQGQARVFTFGIGDDINTHLLDKIAIRTNAYRSYIGPKEDIEIKISNLYTKIQSPVLTGLKLRTDSSIRLTQVYPQELPDLFKGASITVLGRYEGSGTRSIILEGRLKGQPVQYEYRLDFADRETRNEFVAPLWAARKVGWLLDQIRLNGENKELVDEVTELAKKYGIITPYTSYLIVEDEERRVRDNRLQTNHLALPMTAAPAMRDDLKRSYSEMKGKEGGASVAASKQVQAMNDTTNLEQAARTNEQGRSTQPQMRQVLGRTLYQNGKTWVDAAVQNKKYKNTIRIKYNSEEYFKLLQEKPLAARFLALGPNVTFVLEEMLYEVAE
ncbi:MAG: VWA domain-containing protein [Desulfobacteraceae bacterium]|nr:MAG: VWA domain-containing protein [Desulfobacteraceae bacterium]